MQLEYSNYLTSVDFRVFNLRFTFFNFPCVHKTKKSNSDPKFLIVRTIDDVMTPEFKSISILRDI